MSPIPDLFVVGTDTGVGKSMVSLLLMRMIFAMGLSPFYLKPFQTGCIDASDPHSDARFVYDHTPALKGKDPGESVIYCHRNPKAPYFAALDANAELDPGYVRRAIEEKRMQYSPLVVEAAGGLMVPVTRDLLVIDIVQASGCRPLLVAKDGLGTINHTLLSIAALRDKGMEPLGVVFVKSTPSISGTDLVEENIEAVRHFGRVKTSGVIGYINDCYRPPASAFTALKNILP